MKLTAQQREDRDSKIKSKFHLEKKTVKTIAYELNIGMSTVYEVIGRFPSDRVAPLGARNRAWRADKSAKRGRTP